MESFSKSNLAILPLVAAGLFLFVKLQKKNQSKHTTATSKLQLLAAAKAATETACVSEKICTNADVACLPTVINGINMMKPLESKLSLSSSEGDIIVIGIAGGSGSGKTTLAKAIYEHLGADNITYISHDSYYRDITHLTIAEREKQNFDHPDSLDTELLVEHVKMLKSKQQVSIPTYDYATHARQTTNEVLPARPIVLIEGILIFTDPALFSLIDVKIFVDTDDDIRLIRRIQRDTVERGRTLMGVIEQYIATVRPMHLQFVEPSKRNADIIVPEGLNSVALDLVISRLQSHL